MWKTSTLSEECKIFSGNSINAKVKEKLYTNITDGTPYIATKDICYDGKINYLNGILIPEMEENKFRKAKKDCIFICAEGGSAGRKIAFSDRECFFVNKLFCLEASLNVSPKYVYYFLKSKFFQSQFKNALTGLIGGVSLSKIKSFVISYPPIPIQKQIVEKLDAAFSDIDKAINATQKNIENAEALYRRVGESIITENSSDFEQINLDELCTKITDGVHKKPIYTETGIPFIKINNLTNSSGISFENVSYISEDDHKEFIKRTKPERNDLLITKDGTIGVVRLVDTDIEFSIFVSVALIKPKNSNQSRYLEHILSSSFIQNQINPKGAALKHLYLKDLRKLKIPITSSIEMNKIVAKLDSMRSLQCELLSIYDRKILNLDYLKASLLNQAFSGELTKDAA